MQNRSPCPVTVQPRQRLFPLHFIPSLRELEGRNEGSPQPSPHQAKQAQFSPPFSTGELLQPSHRLRGPPLDPRALRPSCTGGPSPGRSTPNRRNKLALFPLGLLVSCLSPSTTVRKRELCSERGVWVAPRAAPRAREAHALQERLPRMAAISAGHARVPRRSRASPRIPTAPCRQQHQPALTNEREAGGGAAPAPTNERPGRAVSIAPGRWQPAQPARRRSARLTRPLPKPGRRGSPKWTRRGPSVTQRRVLDFSTVLSALELTESCSNAVTAGIMGYTWTEGQRD